MRATALLLVLVACQGDSSTVLQRAAQHTSTDRKHAMAALSAGLDDAYAYLAAHPADTAGALSSARPQIARFYTNDETAAFQLDADAGELLLYIPHASVWLGRTDKHLIVETNGLTPTLRAKL